MSMQTVPEKEKWLLYAAYFFGSVYWANCENKTQSFFFVNSKVCSTLLLAIYSAIKNPEKKAFNAALLAHCIGDAVIELPIKNAMLAAIPFFLSGHLLYSSHLLKNTIALNEIDRKKYAGLFIFTLSSLLITRNLVSKTTGILTYAIPVYATALGAVFYLAWLQKEKANITVLSALSYIASDILIATNKLVQPMAMIGYVTWPLYFLGQVSNVLRNTFEISDSTTHTHANEPVR